MYVHDALDETKEVLLGLQHYLSLVRKNARLNVRADLKDIEESLENLANSVGYLTRKDKPAEMLRLVQRVSKHS